MKLLLIVLLMTTLFASSRSSLLKVGEDWEEDVEILIDLFKHTYKGYMSKFHYTQEYPLHEKCIGTEFVIDFQEIVKEIIKSKDDYILKIIKIVERLGHMYEITDAH
mmetsp:Transcript_4945/g.5827  ORF Transcript_4945/g.5827 Transcript_4945/m.5827 type:complete len:107 (-) Transcript_4945:277-597(-)|eukprot:CAMPEP_0168326878 /NCGR_PEP_ID=MMETSP0213-20121227/5571_1 /TAXON_ID=151035 /ORGANISM="Euplotes harpa, Strain FSP1.4" /LENGTH=106 /DNA_ID=CAMNT_0008329689 /DNA_START=19 /DNA_END=339 /DNA_ORIENTATION=+